MRTAPGRAEGKGMGGRSQVPDHKAKQDNLAVQSRGVLGPERLGSKF